MQARTHVLSEIIEPFSVTTYTNKCIISMATHSNIRTIFSSQVLHKNRGSFSRRVSSVKISLSALQRVIYRLCVQQDNGQSQLNERLTKLDENYSALFLSYNVGRGSIKIEWIDIFYQINLVAMTLHTSHIGATRERELKVHARFW